ncbi:hypothetical protein Dimus_031055 [Dionaea muscipula]
METPSPLIHLFIVSYLLLLPQQSSPAAAAAGVGTTASSTNTTTAIEFIRSSCNVTLYRELCYTSLSPYANAVQQDPAQLARVAIGVSLTHALRVASFVSNLSHSASVDGPAASALHDCSTTFSDAVDQIRGSLKQMRQLGSVYDVWKYQLSNVQTWMSAAMTNEDTCVDGFDDVAEGTRVKAVVCRRVTAAMEFVSNALALINSYAAAQIQP